jgi:hypothetical protein
MKLFGALLLFAGLAWATAREPGVKAMPAYYDGKLFTINFRELPSGGETAVHNHNKGINVIYQCDACAGQIGGGDFISVLDAIQGDGFNPLWEEQQITFTDDNTPHQFFSDTEILDAAASGEIMISDTDEMYTCSVTGPKKK